MKFEGVVDQVHKQYVDCTLYDLTDQTQPTEFAAISLHKFSEPVYEGMVFQWTFKDDGSEITVMKPKEINKEEIEQRANKLAELLRVENE